MIDKSNNVILGRLRQALDDKVIENYDCVVGNIAKFLLLQGHDPDLAVGSVLSFEPSVAGDGCWTLDQVSARQIEVIAALPGVTIDAKEGLHLPPRRHASVVVGDGRDMSWTPYFNNESLEHGFLCLPVDDGFVGYDAYNTITQYGPARPQIIPTEEWTKIVPWRSILVSEVEPGTDLRVLTPVTHRADEVFVERYLEAIRRQTQALEKLAVDTWILARARSVNLAFARKTGRTTLEQACAVSQRAWAKASEAVYVALQRKNRGKPYPQVFKEAIATAIMGEATLFSAWSCQHGFG